jgi:hypothetical protein
MEQCNANQHCCGGEPSQEAEMSYRVTWRLVGRADRLLDSGNLDEFGEHASAVEAIATLLSGFPLSGRNEEAGYWWARRSPDSDLEVRLLLRG